MNMNRMLMAALAAPVVAMSAPAYAAKEAPAPIAIPAPPAGKGQIVWFRPGGMGFALGCSVNEGGQKISSLGAGKYFIMATTPGRHEFTVQSEAKDVLALEVEEGETQFASCKIKMGIMVGRPDIRPSTEEEFRAATCTGGSGPCCRCARRSSGCGGTRCRRAVTIPASGA